MRTKHIILTISLLLSATAFLKAQSLDSLLSKAYSNNPELRALQLEYEAALQKAPQVSQLPDPTVGVGIPVMAPQTRLGAQVLTVSATQMFPWFGTLKAKKEVALTMAKSKYEKVAASRLDIDYQIKSAYFELILLQEKINILQKNIRILEAIRQVALAKVESGKSIASDALTVELKMEELSNKIKLFEAQKQSFNASINALTHLPDNKRIAVDTTSLSFAMVNFDLNALRQKIEANHPLIKQLDWSIEASKKEEALNEMSGRPSFGIGLDYSVVSPRTDANPDHNGRDILIPKLSVSIPLYRTKYRAKKAEEALNQEAYSLMKENLSDKMTGNLLSYYTEYEQAQLSFASAEKQLKLSGSAYDILLSDYSSHGNRFVELMKMENDINGYEIDKVTAIVQSYLAKFKIEHLTDF